MNIEVRYIPDHGYYVTVTLTAATCEKVGAKRPLSESFKALYEAGGKAWDGVSDPQALIDEVRGNEDDTARLLRKKDLALSFLRHELRVSDSVCRASREWVDRLLSMTEDA